MRDSIAHRLAAAALLLAAQGLAVQRAVAQTMYRVVPVHAGAPHAIDSSGKILLHDGDDIGYICSKASCRVLPSRHPQTFWRNFNDQGALTGYSGESALRKDAQHGGGARVITRGYGIAIAPDGSVVGRDEHFHAFLFTDRRIPLIGLAGQGASASAINSRHQIVGRSGVAGGELYRATMWVDGGPPQDLGIAPGHDSSWALAINESGVAVGFSNHPVQSLQPARFANGSVQILQLPLADAWGLAQSINAAGSIVGWFGDRTSTVAGIVEGDRMVDLNTRLRPADAAVYKLRNAVAINDAGQIAAAYVDAQTGHSMTVRLDPIP